MGTKTEDEGEEGENGDALRVEKLGMDGEAVENLETALGVDVEGEG